MEHLILLVEDYAPVRENTIELLELFGYRTITACNGREGLAAALINIPDLILSDIQMPGMNGLVLYKLVREHASLDQTRFVFFTASFEKTDIEFAMLMGADDYIVKPFTGEILLQVMQKHLPTNSEAILPA